MLLCRRIKKTINYPFLRICFGNKAEFPRLVGSLPFLSGFTWAFSYAGQPTPLLQEEVLIVRMLKKQAQLNIKSNFFIFDLNL